MHAIKRAERLGTDQRDVFKQYRDAVARTDGLIDPGAAHSKDLAEVRARAEMRMARLRSFLTYLGDPHRQYPVVHVGGTSGKGSTSTAIASILSAAGYKTGLHTSPYLQVATEKLAIDGQLIAADQFSELVDQVLAAASSWAGSTDGRLTYGEVWFALLALYFAQEQVDVAVIEVGAGGRFDLTNVVQPAVSVITSIGIDHTETLGKTIPEIAWHKAGIIKPGVPVVTAVSEPDALAPILAEATLTRSEVIRPEIGVDYQALTLPDGEPAVQVSSGRTYRLGMRGSYQATNAAVAIATVQAIASRGFEVSEDAITAGLGSARQPGRFEAVQTSPTVILDGAHNLQKIGALVSDLPALTHLADGAQRIVVLGVLEAKDHTGIVREVAAYSDAMILTRPRVLAKPGADPATLIATARAAGFTGSIEIEDDPRVAIEHAISRADATRGDIVLVTGSLYLIGNLRGLWYPDAEIVRQRTQWPLPDNRS